MFVESADDARIMQISGKGQQALKIMLKMTATVLIVLIRGLRKSLCAPQDCRLLS